MVNVLIADDNAGIEIVRILLSTFLGREGIPIDVRVYPTIRDAENQINWAQVALVDEELYDPMTHRLDSGYDFAQRIKTENPDAYTVMFSGGEVNSSRKEGKFDEFIPKSSLCEVDFVQSRLAEIIRSYHRRQTQGQ